MKNQKEDLQKKLAQLEAENKHLVMELCGLDTLMRKVGFPGGVAALKQTAQDFCNRDAHYYDDIS